MPISDKQLRELADEYMFDVKQAKEFVHCVTAKTFLVATWWNRAWLLELSLLSQLVNLARS